MYVVPPVLNKEGKLPKYDRMVTVLDILVQCV